MRRPAAKITDVDLCAVDAIARDQPFTFRQFADRRAPWLTTTTARNVLRKMIREGILTTDGQGNYRPTEQGLPRIRASCNVKRR